MRTSRSIVSAMYGVYHCHKKNYGFDADFEFQCKKVMDQLITAKSIHWYGHVLKNEDGHVFGRELMVDMENEGSDFDAKKDLEELGDGECMLIG